MEIGAFNWPAVTVESDGHATVVFQFVGKDLKTYRFEGRGMLKETDTQEYFTSAEKFLPNKETDANSNQK